MRRPCPGTVMWRDHALAAVSHFARRMSVCSGLGALSLSALSGGELVIDARCQGLGLCGRDVHTRCNTRPWMRLQQLFVV